MIRIESPDLTALVRRLQAASDNAPRDLRRALGTQRRAVGPETVRAVRTVYNITATRVREGLTVGPVDAADLSVTITGGKAGIGLQNFPGTRQVGRRNIGRAGTGFGGRRGYADGVRVQVLKAKPPEILRHAFLPKSKRIPFQRATPNTPRLPIEPIFGPSLADMLNNTFVFFDLQRRFVERATAELNRLITNAVERRG